MWLPAIITSILGWFALLWCVVSWGLRPCFMILCKCLNGINETKSKYWWGDRIMDTALYLYYFKCLPYLVWRPLDLAVIQASCVVRPAGIRLLWYWFQISIDLLHVSTQNTFYSCYSTLSIPCRFPTGPKQVDSLSFLWCDIVRVITAREEGLLWTGIGALVMVPMLLLLCKAPSREKQTTGTIGSHVPRLRTRAWQGFFASFGDSQSTPWLHGWPGYRRLEGGSFSSKDMSASFLEILEDLFDSDRQLFSPDITSKETLWEIYQAFCSVQRTSDSRADEMNVDGSWCQYVHVTPLFAARAYCKALSVI
jgi:hypothetical protein